MCGPAAAPAIKAVTAVATNPAVIMGMNVAQWYQGEQLAKAGREQARHALAVSESNLATRKMQQDAAAEHNKDKIRRQSAAAQGQMLASGTMRGLAKSQALAAINQEYRARETDTMSAIANQRESQSFAMAIERGAEVRKFQQRMMANQGTGVLGLGMSLAQGAMMGQMTSGMSSAASQRAGFALGKMGPSGLYNTMVPGLNAGMGMLPGSPQVPFLS